MVHGQRRDDVAQPRSPPVQASYEAGVTDEFIKPIVIVDADGSRSGRSGTGTRSIFFNFRADRARQLTRALALDDFDGFERPHRPRVHFTTMTVYDRTFNLPVVFTPQTFSGNLADVLSEHGRTNLRLAETEKYAHVTYFFNCGREEPYPGEDRILVPSQKVATYDLMPEMSAAGITDALVADLAERRHEVVICNFANADMVGHTGNLAGDDRGGRDARRLPRPHRDRAARGGRHAPSSPPITATPSRCGTTSSTAPHTAHTTNPVPVILCDEALQSDGRCGTARCATSRRRCWGCCGSPISPEMTGSSLLE